MSRGYQYRLLLSSLALTLAYLVNPASVWAEPQEVTGCVKGYSTIRADVCEGEVPVLVPMPHARVTIEETCQTIIANADGKFTFTIDDVNLTIKSAVHGAWFQVIDCSRPSVDCAYPQQLGPFDPDVIYSTEEEYVVVRNELPDPPDPDCDITIIHNDPVDPNSGESTRAEVNAYVHANIVRDFVLRYDSSFPVIESEPQFPLIVNGTALCDGRASYGPNSSVPSVYVCAAGIVASGEDCPNSAFSSVIHHEYGHNLVKAVVPAYNDPPFWQGMGDLMALLILDDPCFAAGLFGICEDCYRTADNNLEYPCTGCNTYDLASLLAGCVWDVRNELIETGHSNLPSDEHGNYTDVLAPLVIKAVQEYTYDPEDPNTLLGIVDLFLRYDDALWGDANIFNGTPHCHEICSGFAAHNMGCREVNCVVREIAGRVKVENYKGYLGEPDEPGQPPAHDFLYTGNGHDRDGNGPVPGPDHDPARDNIYNEFLSFELNVDPIPLGCEGQAYCNVVATQVGTVYPLAQYIAGPAHIKPHAQ